MFLHEVSIWVSRLRTDHPDPGEWAPPPTLKGPNTVDGVKGGKWLGHVLSPALRHQCCWFAELQTGTGISFPLSRLIPCLRSLEGLNCQCLPWLSSLYKARRLRPFLASIRTWANSFSKERGMYISISVLQAMCDCRSMTLGDWVLRWYRMSGILRMHFLSCFVCFLALSHLLDLKHW